MLIKINSDPTARVPVPRRPPAVWDEPTEVYARGVVRLGPAETVPPDPPTTVHTTVADEPAAARVERTPRRRAAVRAAIDRRTNVASAAGLAALTAGLLALAGAGGLGAVLWGYCDSALLLGGLLLLMLAWQLDRQPDGPGRHADRRSPASARRRTVARL